MSERRDNVMTVCFKLLLKNVEDLILFAIYIYHFCFDLNYKIYDGTQFYVSRLR